MGVVGFSNLLFVSTLEEMELLRDGVDPNCGKLPWGGDVQMPIDDNVLLVDLGGICPLDNSNTKPPPKQIWITEVNQKLCLESCRDGIAGKGKN